LVGSTFVIEERGPFVNRAVEGTSNSHYGSFEVRRVGAPNVTKIWRSNPALGLLYGFP